MAPCITSALLQRDGNQSPRLTWVCSSRNKVEGESWLLNFVIPECTVARVPVFSVCMLHLKQIFQLSEISSYRSTSACIRHQQAGSPFTLRLGSCLFVYFVLLMPYITKVKVIWLFLRPQSHTPRFPVIFTLWISSNSDTLFIFNFLSVYMFMCMYVCMTWLPEVDSVSLSGALLPVV